MSIETVPVEARVQLNVTANMRHLCPFVKEVDNGTITLSWIADGWTFELHALRAYLGTFSDREISHEALTEEVRAELGGHHGISNVTVSSTWDTAGMEVRVETTSGDER